MEKILVAMDPVRTNFYAGIHALNLAKRIKAKVLFLLVFSPPTKEKRPHFKEEMAASVKRRLESLIEDGRSEGIAVDYYLAYGNYESELVSFVQENQITLLVVELPAEQGYSSEVFKDFLEKIRHRINCRIEVVHEKTEISERKEYNSVASVPTDSRK
jgi:hypothetical protein